MQKLFPNEQQAQYGILNKTLKGLQVEDTKDNDLIDDPRHQVDTPVDWLRYFFPKDFDVREGSRENAYLQYFDVALCPLQEDITANPPKWTPNAYFRLSFTQTHLLGNQDVLERMPDYSSPLEALDFTKGNWPIYAEGAQKHLEEVKARTWKDAFPMVDLLRGLLLYLLRQMDIGQKLASEYAKRDGQRLLDEERLRLGELHDRQMALAREEWERETSKQVAAATEAARKQMAEEMALQLKTITEEKDRWIQKNNQADQNIKKLNETISRLNQQIDQLMEQINSERQASLKSLSEKDQELKACKIRMRDLEDGLVKARRCIVQALNARSKEEVMSVVTASAALAVPGAHSYIAQLTTTDAKDSKEDPVIAKANKEISALDTADGSALTNALRELTPGFFSSPLKDVTNLEMVQDSLVLKYVRASQGHEFMVGQKMMYGTGLSWGPIMTAAKDSDSSGTRQSRSGSGEKRVEAPKLSKHVLLVPDISEASGLHIFRPSAVAGVCHGSYIAVPIMGKDGEVVGLLGVDTVSVAILAGNSNATLSGKALMGPGVTQLAEEQVEFLKQLAAAASQAVSRDQEALEDILSKVTLLANESEKVDNTEVFAEFRDPEQYADLNGGLKMFQEALTVLKDLSDEDFKELQEIDNPDDATLAILKSILAVSGEVEDAHWPNIRKKVSRDLVNNLINMDIKGAWSEWQATCRFMAPLLHLESLEGPLEDIQCASPASKALGRWLTAVRKISAGNSVMQKLKAAMASANAALMKTFQGDSSNALTELRSYRVPPKVTFKVLQLVLLLGGNDEEDCENWGKMRIMTNFKMIKKLTDLKPDKVEKQHVKLCIKLTEGNDIKDVKKESLATLVLFKWLCHFAKIGEMLLL